MRGGSNSELSSSVRAFVALPLSESTIHQLASVQTQLSSEAVRQATHLRLTPAHQFHVTLAFLGNLVRTQIDFVCQAASEVASRYAAFRLIPQGLVIFPSIRKARVVGVGLQDPNDALGEAVAMLHTRLRAAGLALENRAFRAHITLARLRLPGYFSVENDDVLSSVQLITCARVTVYESERGTTGAKYHELHSMPLGS